MQKKCKLICSRKCSITIQTIHQSLWSGPSSQSSQRMVYEPESLIHLTLAWHSIWNHLEADMSLASITKVRKLFMPTSQLFARPHEHGICQNDIIEFLSRKEKAKIPAGCQVFSWKRPSTLSPALEQVIQIETPSLSLIYSNKMELLFFQKQMASHDTSCITLRLLSTRAENWKVFSPRLSSLVLMFHSSEASVLCWLAPADM